MLSRFSFSVVLVAALLMLLPLASAQDAEKDTDKDGLTDAQEKILGSHPDQAEEFKLLNKDGLESEARRKKPTYDATKDILTFEYCHVGEERHMWRVTFAEPFRPEDSVLHFYVDADADKKTGRKKVGNEYMLTIDGGKARLAVYTPEGKGSGGPAPAVVMTDNAVIMSADVKLSRDDKGIRYSIRVLCHTRKARRDEPAKMYDGISWISVEGFPVRPGTVPQRPRK